jgi:hypothetical protein
MILIEEIFFRNSEPKNDYNPFGENSKGWSIKFCASVRADRISPPDRLPAKLKTSDEPVKNCPRDRYRFGASRRLFVNVTPVKFDGVAAGAGFSAGVVYL